MSPIWLCLVAAAAVIAWAILFFLLYIISVQRKTRSALAHRTKTVNRLLDFSQSILGAGKPKQVFETLCHYLHSELELSGVAVFTSESVDGSEVVLQSVWPQGLIAPKSVPEFDAALCPCFRQSIPRTFGADTAPIRCVIDLALSLPPSHVAHCIPFGVGHKWHGAVHMLLPPVFQWTEHLRQLAQTYVNISQSVLANLQLLADAERQSSTDVLTGLFNRRSMDTMLQREVALADRHGLPLSLVMIDMDYFKEINDQHGHAAGDHLLKSFADCVRMTLRKTDLAFRFGGDEFVIALPQTPLAQAQQVVQKLRQAFLSVDFSDAIAHLEQNPTMSIGVAERGKAAKTLTLADLLAAADQALYEAKNSERNCVRVYEPPRAA